MYTIENIFDILEKNERLSKQVLNLVPSESVCSPLSKLPFLLDGYHRYFFNTEMNPDSWHFRGGQAISSIETNVAIPLLKELSKAKFVSLRPLSGMHAMLIVLAGLTKIGDTIFCVAPNLGGHYATHANARRFGLKVIDILGPNPHTIDLEHLEKIAKNIQPALIYIDQCNGLFPFDIRKIVEVIRRVSPNTKIHVDCSHWLGLIFGKALANPLEEGADSFGGSTHKTFPGPHKGIFVTNNKKLYNAHQDAQYSMISNHNLAGVISLALCLLEFKEYNGEEYTKQIIKNSKALARVLSSLDIEVIGKELGFTKSHQLWVNTESLGISAKLASDRLYNANIRVNYLLDLPGFKTSGLRLGVNEATYLGLRENHIDKLGTIIVSAIKGKDKNLLKKDIADILNDMHPQYEDILSPTFYKKITKLLQSTYFSINKS